MNERPVLLQVTPVEFHGRESELDSIICLATTQPGPRQSQVLLIEGPGGIGKSMLLRRAIEKLKVKHCDVQCVGPLDMDDTDYRVASNTGLAIANALGVEHFSRYIEMLNKYQGKELERVDRSTILAYIQSGDRYFVNDYIHYVNTHRVVIFVDTIEAIRDTHVWAYFMRIMAALPNTLFVLAGRPTLSPLRKAEAVLDQSSTLEAFRKMPLIGNEGVHYMELRGWSKIKGREFVEQRATKLLGQQLPKHWVENLLHLSRCQPLHLALAIERLQSSKMPVLEQTETDIARLAPLYQEELRGDGPISKTKELEKLVPNIGLDQLSEEGQALCNDFERYLVQQYAGPSPLAEAIRRMAHIRRRLNNDMYKQVMAFEPAVQGPPEWDVLLQQSWIRHRVGEYVTLHDVFSELIRRHIWPVRDPSGDHRRELSQRVVQLYDEQIAAQQMVLAGFNDRFKAEAIDVTGRAVDRFSELAQILRQVQEISRRVWVLEAERLYYKLDANPMQGYAAFVEKFDQATRESQMAVRETLVLEIEGFLQQFKIGTPEYYQIRLREIQAAIDEGGIAERAERLVSELLPHYTIPKQQYELLKLQANANMRIPGSTRKALDLFQEALALTRNYDELQEYEGDALMELGWANRQLGRWKDAAEQYAKALGIAPLQNPALSASIQSGWAYVEALMGHRPRANSLIEEALVLRRLQGNPEEIGISLSVQGEVYRYQREFAKARQAYEAAVATFSEQGNSKWIGQVEQQLAIALIQQDPKGNLEDAKYHANSALYLCHTHNPRAYPSALNRAGRVMALAKEHELAFNLFREGIEMAEAIGDDWFLVANCIEYAELAYRRWEETGRDDLRQEIFTYGSLVEKKEQSGVYSFEDLFGRWHLVQGHVAWRDGVLGGKTQCWHKALDEYKDGFLRLAQGYYGSSGIYALPSEKETLKKHMLELPSDEALRWCNEFKEAWKETNASGDLLPIVYSLYGELASPYQRKAAP